MATIRETIYLGRDNTINVIIKESGSAKNLSGVTEIQAVFSSGVTVSSSSSSTLFSGVTSSSGSVAFKFGSVAGITANTNYDMEVIIYDVTHPNGVMWGSIPVQVKG